MSSFAIPDTKSLKRKRELEIELSKEVEDQPTSRDASGK